VQATQLRQPAVHLPRRLDSPPQHARSGRREVARDQDPARQLREGPVDDEHRDLRRGDHVARRAPPDSAPCAAPPGCPTTSSSAATSAAVRHRTSAPEPPTARQCAAPPPISRRAGAPGDFSGQGHAYSPGLRVRSAPHPPPAGIEARWGPRTRARRTAGPRARMPAERRVAARDLRPPGVRGGGAGVLGVHPRHTHHDRADRIRHRCLHAR
jgi:hypothetical protein